MAEPSEAILAILERAQEHLLPSEPGTPGTREINALGCLRFVLGDERVDAEERELVLTGAISLDEESRKLEGERFVSLDAHRLQHQGRSAAEPDGRRVPLRHGPGRIGA